MDSIYMKSKLSNQELLLVNSEIEKNSKNVFGYFDIRFDFS